MIIEFTALYRSIAALHVKVVYAVNYMFSLRRQFIVEKHAPVVFDAE